MIASSTSPPSEGDNPIWYEQTPSLKRALLLLKATPALPRELVAKEMVAYAKELQLKDTQATTALGFDKVVAMMQTKQHAQAFANDPFLVKALNAIFDLSPDGRHQVGLKMLLCLQAVDSYKQSPKFAGFEGHAGRIALHNVINSVFNQDLEVFKEQGEERRRQREEAKTFAKLYQEELAELARLDAEPLPEEDALEASPTNPEEQAASADEDLTAARQPHPQCLLPMTLALLPDGDARLKLAF